MKHKHISKTMKKGKSGNMGGKEERTADKEEKERSKQRMKMVKGNAGRKGEKQAENEDG